MSQLGLGDEQNLYFDHWVCCVSSVADVDLGVLVELMLLYTLYKGGTCLGCKGSF